MTRARTRPAVVLTVLGVACSTGVPLASAEATLPAWGASTQLVSRNNNGVQSNRLIDSSVDISAHGRFVVFATSSTNLVDGDTNRRLDVFVRDRLSGTTARVSVTNDGGQANGPSYSPDISADGRYVVFQSLATNLVAGDTNDAGDIFVRDLREQTTTRVTRPTDGSQANGYSEVPTISEDGSTVAFLSVADNLVPGDTNDGPDIFTTTVEGTRMTRISETADGSEPNGISLQPLLSKSGRFVGFSSGASNLVPDDTNDTFDGFVYDRRSGKIDRVSVSSDGGQAFGEGVEVTGISRGGRIVAMNTAAGGLVPNDDNNRDDVFIRNRVTGRTTRVSISATGEQLTDSTLAGTLTDNGRFVAMLDLTVDVIPGDTNQADDVIVLDRWTGKRTMATVDRNGMGANDNPARPEWSGDAKHLVFTSYASDLVSGDRNDTSDVFVRDRDVDLS